MSQFNSDTLQIELTEEEKKSLGICIGCGEAGTRADNTLCQACWYDAEGEND